MNTMASQITSLTIVYSTVYSGAYQRKHQSSASLAFLRGIHQWPVKFLAQRASDAENISIWWRHHDRHIYLSCQRCTHNNIRFDWEIGFLWKRSKFLRQELFYLRWDLIPLPLDPCQVHYQWSYRGQTFSAPGLLRFCSQRKRWIDNEYNVIMCILSIWMSHLVFCCSWVMVDSTDIFQAYFTSCEIIIKLIWPRF